MEDNKTIYSLLWKEENEYLTHSNLPDNIWGSKEGSTVVIVFMMEKEVQECCLYEQEGVFCLGIRAGQLYLSCNSHIILTSKEAAFPGIILKRYYHVAVLSDEKKASLWVNGCLIDEGSLLLPDCMNEKSYRIGYHFPGKLKELCVYPRCLSDEELWKSLIYHLDAGKETAYFPFCGEITDQGKYQLATSVAGLPFLASSIRAMQFDGDGYAYFSERECALGQFSLIMSICPKRSRAGRSILFQNSTPDLENGFRLFLERNDDHDYSLGIEVYIGQNLKEYISRSFMTTDNWTTIGMIQSEQDIALIINGKEEQSGIKTAFPEGKYQCMIGAGLKRDSLLPIYHYTGWIYCIAVYNDAMTEKRLQMFSDCFPGTDDDDIIAYYHAEDNYIFEEVSMEKSQLLGGASTGISRIRNLKLSQPTPYVFPETLPKEWESLSEEEKWRIDWIGGVIALFFDYCIPIFLTDTKKQWQRYLSLYRDGICNNKSFYEITDQFLLTGRVMDAKGVAAFLQELTENGFNGYLKAAVRIAYHNNEIRENEDLPFIMDVLADYIKTILSLPPEQSRLGKAVEEIRSYTLKMMRIRPKSIHRGNIEVRLFSIQYAFPEQPECGSGFIRHNTDEDILPPEWNDDSSQEKPAYAAYIISKVKNPYISVRLKIRFTQTYATKVHMKLLGDDLDKGSLGNIEMGFDMAQTGYANLIIPLSEQTISKKQDFSPEVGGWYFRIQIEEDEFFLQNTYHRIYFCPFKPSEPWVGFLTNQYVTGELLYPWVDAWNTILPEISTKMEILDEKTIMKSIADKVTRWLFQHPAFIMDMQKGNSHYTIHDNQNNAYIFNMEAFLHDEREEGKKHLINSVDTAMAVASFTNLFGNYLRQQIISSKTPIVCNQIVPLGMQEWKDYVYQGEEKGIRQHHVAIVWPESTCFYDASLCLDGGDYPQKRAEEQGANKSKMIVSYIEAAENSEGEVNITQPYNRKVYKERLLAQGQNYTSTEKITSWGIGKNERREK